MKPSKYVVLHVTKQQAIAFIKDFDIGCCEGVGGDGSNVPLLRIMEEYFDLEKNYFVNYEPNESSNYRLNEQL